MFGKKKKELTDEQKGWLERIDILKERVHQHDSNVNYQAISSKERIKEESEILSELEKLECEISGFDEMMGHPMDMLEEIFPC